MVVKSVHRLSEYKLSLNNRIWRYKIDISTSISQHVSAEQNAPVFQEPPAPIWLELEDIPVGAFFILVVTTFMLGVFFEQNYWFVISGMVAYAECLLCFVLFLQANKRKADERDAINGHVTEETFGKATFVIGLVMILFGTVPAILGILMAYPSIFMTDKMLNSAGLELAGSTFGGLSIASIGFGLILIGLVCIWDYLNQK